MQLRLSFPLFALVGVTRAVGGIGLGLLIANRIRARQRERVGKLLFGVAAASSIPLAVAVIRRNRRHHEGAGVMEPMTQIYTPDAGTVDDAELIDHPQHPESVILPDRP